MQILEKIFEIILLQNFMKYPTIAKKRRFFFRFFQILKDNKNKFTID